MPTFDTPGPISATIDLVVGDVRISAGDARRHRRRGAAERRRQRADVNAAEQTRVEFADGHLLVKAPEAALVAPAAATAGRSTSRSSSPPARTCAAPAR